MSDSVQPSETVADKRCGWCTGNCQCNCCQNASTCWKDCCTTTDRSCCTKDCTCACCPRADEDQEEVKQGKRSRNCCKSEEKKLDSVQSSEAVTDKRCGWCAENCQCTCCQNAPDCWKDCCPVSDRSCCTKDCTCACCPRTNEDQVTSKQHKCSGNCCKSQEKEVASAQSSETFTDKSCGWCAGNCQCNCCQNASTCWKDCCTATDRSCCTKDCTCACCPRTHGQGKNERCKCSGGCCNTRNKTVEQ